jgi:lysozyme family protein
MNFDKAIEVILKHEGGYINHVDDPGGETNFGITKRSYPDLDIKNLTMNQAKQIYERDYWKANKIDKYPPFIRLQMFDMCVNMGAGNAGKVLQRALNRSGAGLTVDGKVGVKTFEAVDHAPVTIAHELAIERVAYYVDLVRARARSSVFLLGWCRRAVEVFRS